MRLVIARCSVDYVGRLTAHLPMATRLILLKADGSVSVHADGGAYKPLNWMVPPCTVREGDGVWRVDHGKTGDALVITIEEIISDEIVRPRRRPRPAEGRRGGASPGAAG